MDAQDRDYEAQREVERDEEPVERAPRAREEAVQQPRQRYGKGVHGCRRPDENPLPEVRRRVLPVLDAHLRPGVRKVDEEDQAEEDEYGGADEGDVVAPEDEEAVWDEEGDGDEDEPDECLWTPPSVLDLSPLLLGRLHTNEEGAQDEMEQRQCKADTVDLFKLVRAEPASNLAYR